MHKPDYSRAEVKRFADRILTRLQRDNKPLSYELVLEAMAAGFGERDWNTLSAALRNTNGSAPRQMASPRIAANNDTHTPSLSLTLLEWALTHKGVFLPAGKPTPFQKRGKDGSPCHALVLGSRRRSINFFTNLSNLEFILRDDHRHGLSPRLAIVDTGGSQGLFKALEGISTEKLIKSVTHVLHETDVVNMFDTPLGHRLPSNTATREVINFVYLLVIEDTKGLEPKDASTVRSLLKVLVEDAYARHSDITSTTMPKPYLVGVDEAVDNALTLIGGGKPSTWWQCVDMLFTAGRMTDAKLAQRHAVPTVNDLMACLDSPSIYDVYRFDRVMHSSELLTTLVGRVLASAMRWLPGLGRPTSLKLSDVNVRTVDISPFIYSRSGNANRDRKMAAIAFLMARRLVCGNPPVSAGAGMNTVPVALHAEYDRHHGKEALNLRGVQNRLVFNDLHKVDYAGVVKMQILEDMTHGREQDVEIMACFLMPDDDTKEIGALCAQIWLLDCADASMEERTPNIFSISDTARSWLKGMRTGCLLSFLIEKTGRGQTEELVMHDVPKGIQERLQISKEFRTEDDQLIEDFIAGLLSDKA